MKMRDYMDRRVTSPIWGTPPPCKQALTKEMSFFFTAFLFSHRGDKFFMFSFQQRMSFVFLCRSSSLSLFFALSFAGPPPLFSFSLSLSFSIFQICGHDN